VAPATSNVRRIHVDGAVTSASRWRNRQQTAVIEDLCDSLASLRQRRCSSSLTMMSSHALPMHRCDGFGPSRAGVWPGPAETPSRRPERALAPPRWRRSHTRGKGTRPRCLSTGRCISLAVGTPRLASVRGTDRRCHGRSRIRGHGSTAPNTLFHLLLLLPWRASDMYRNRSWRCMRTGVGLSVRPAR
jgi:hypothetical protein